MTCLDSILQHLFADDIISMHWNDEQILPIPIHFLLLLQDLITYNTQHIRVLNLW